MSEGKESFFFPTCLRGDDHSTPGQISANSLEEIQVGEKASCGDPDWKIIGTAVMESMQIDDTKYRKRRRCWIKTAHPRHEGENESNCEIFHESQSIKMYCFRLHFLSVTH